jgi:hypothetical protein
MMSVRVSSRPRSRFMRPVPADGFSLGPAIISCVVCAVCAALAVLWSAGSFLQILLAYMGGGWLGLALGILPRFSSRHGRGPD